MTRKTGLAFGSGLGSSRVRVALVFWSISSLTGRASGSGAFPSDLVGPIPLIVLRVVSSSAFRASSITLCKIVSRRLKTIVQFLRSVLVTQQYVAMPEAEI